MSKYFIQQGNISSVITVTDYSTGQKYDCFYISDTRPVQLGIAGTKEDAENRFRSLPMEVQAAVNKQFGTIFNIPGHMRHEFIRNFVPFEVFINA